ncbi:signal-regulatory protein delta-like [Vipera latastei]
MAWGVFLFRLFFMQLPCLLTARDGGVKAEDPWLSQPQRSVTVVIGEDLRLECEVPDKLRSGAVKWFLGEGPQRKLIYADAQIDEKDERITRISPNSNTDFTIFIRNVSLEDAGTYYCVKEKTELWGTKDWLKGQGTHVVVKGQCGQAVDELRLLGFLV